MSSEEDNINDGDGLSQNSKKRRVQRACDVCRRKKIRCDGGQMPGNKCSNCITYNYECTYMEAAKKRGPPKGYVESLETRLEKMEKLLNRLCPDADFSKELGGHFDKDSWLQDSRIPADSASKSAFGASVSSQLTTNNGPPIIKPTDPDDLEPSDDEVMAHQSLVQSLNRLHVKPTSLRFFGKSSSIMFLQAAMDLKREYAGESGESRQTVNTYPLLLHSDHRRTKWWSLHPWLTSQLREVPQPHEPHNFPDEDLMLNLVESYFVNVNTYSPLLHRPTFEINIRDGLHLRDEGFGSTVLLVCAIGAKFVDDSRVLLEGYADNLLSSGWEWFKQVQMIRKSLLAPPRLYDLQVYCLTAMFLQGSSAPQACWTIIGVGIRMAQDVGAHRKKVYHSTPTVEEELWKRAFWVLVSMDRSISSALGRPCAIQDEDFDLDLPTECDDEYWIHPDPEVAFKQPPGKPSTISAFNCFLRLNQILAFALRTIYSINKSKALLGFVGQQWEQHIVAELDSALNKWIDSVPDHLRWDPNNENIVFLNQSANLYASYYMLQISVHRPFIPSPRKPSPLSFPSLAICTNAARSCTHVLDVQATRCVAPLYINMMAMFTSGIVLLLNIWGGKRSGISTDPAKEMEDVHKCMRMLKSLECRWHIAGRLCDILRELASVGDLPLPQNTPPSQKRDRDADSPKSATSSSASTPAASSSLTEPSSRNIAGTRRVSRDTSYVQSSSSRLPMQHMPASESLGMLTSCDLPIHSDELGRMPLHPDYTSGDGSVHPPVPLDSSWYVSAAGSVGTMPGNAQAGPSNVPVGSGDLDPSIASMFTMQGNTFDPLMSTLPTPLPPNIQDYTMQGTADLSQLQNSLAGAADPSFADNTLAMWSTAPSSFEWDDWGTYISGMNMNIMGSSRSAGT